MQAIQSGDEGSDGGFDFDFGDDEMEDTEEVAEDNNEEDMNKSILIIEEYNPEEDLIKSKNLSKLVPVILSVTNKNGTTFQRKYYKKPNELKKILEQKIKETKVENPVIIDKKAGKTVTKDAIIETIKRNPNIPMEELLSNNYSIVNKPNDLGKANFKSKKLLESHYNKHKAEFGNISLEEYLEIGRRVLSTKKESIKGFRKKDYIVKYDTLENVFCSVKNGKILTIFKPERGLGYYERQFKKHNDK